MMRIPHLLRLSASRRRNLFHGFGVCVYLFTMYTVIQWSFLQPVDLGLPSPRTPQPTWSNSISQATFSLYSHNHTVYSHSDMVHMVLGDQKGAAFIEGLLNQTLPPNVAPPEPGGYIINNPHRCLTTDPLLYLLFVYTAPAHFERRAALRATWAKDDVFKRVATRHIFLLGRTDNESIQREIEKENNGSHDIIQANFTDSYSNLTYKGVLALRWSRQYCSRAQHLVKTDDDLFVDITQIYKVLKIMEGQTRFIVGYIGNGKIHRGYPKRRKNLADHLFPSQERYPMFFHGATYVLSADIVKELHEAVGKTPFFPIDDVYMTGILGGQVHNVKYVRYKGAAVRKYKPLTFPKFSKKVNVSQIYKLWSYTTKLLNSM